MGREHKTLACQDLAADWPPCQSQIVTMPTVFTAVPQQKLSLAERYWLALRGLSRQFDGVALKSPTDF